MIFVPNSNGDPSFYKSFLTFNVNKKTSKEFLGVWELALVAFGGFFF
jgi:hypothetical protein